ncbi:MAG: malonyl-ACP O-methyltransferase BioC [Pseudomonadota bacterium]|nr:MAG: malonyl-ACP O-methyltransferase BioC [Pseudomonadota bacterium]
MSGGFDLDNRLARASFERAANTYDKSAVLQREVGTRVTARMDLVRITPHRILDVGSGTGHGTQLLARRYPGAQVLALDIAPAMLARARQRFSWWSRWRGRCGFVCGDAEALPIADASVDLIFSNLTLQWCTDLEGTFREFRRVLAPGGLLMFTTFGPDTLKELRAAWEVANGQVHVHEFADMHDIGDALLSARFADPVMDMEYFELTYRDVRALMQDLKQLGAHNAGVARVRTLTGKNRLRAMSNAYEHHRRDGVIPATGEVVYGHAWMPEQSAAMSERGAVPISLEQLHAGNQE